MRRACGWRVQTTEAENFDRYSLELAGNRSQHRSNAFAEM